eukprot:14906918-Alexandrium_andersonii.AAC.1
MNPPADRTARVRHDEHATASHTEHLQTEDAPRSSAMPHPLHATASRRHVVRRSLHCTTPALDEALA